MRYWIQFNYACQFTLWGNPVGPWSNFSSCAYVAVPEEWISDGMVAKTAVDTLNELATRIFYHESWEHEKYLVSTAADEGPDGAGRMLLGIEHAVLGPVEEELREWTRPEKEDIRSINFYQVNADGSFKFVEPTKPPFDS